MTRIEAESYTVEDEDVVEASKLWWLLTLMGAISLVAGGILVAKPSQSLNVLAVVFGIFLLIDGIIALIWALRHRGASRGLDIIVGVLGIVFGLILVRHPSHVVSFIGLLIGIWLVAAGAVRMVRGIETRSVWRVVIALLELIIGIIVVGDPHIGYATLAILTGIWLIINGIATIGLSLVLRRAGRDAAT
jgi:uncharacterized membrane protein HdeD (DUF308 family)